MPQERIERTALSICNFRANNFKEELSIVFVYVVFHSATETTLKNAPRKEVRGLMICAHFSRRPISSSGAPMTNSIDLAEVTTVGYRLRIVRVRCSWSDCELLLSRKILLEASLFSEAWLSPSSTRYRCYAGLCIFLFLAAIALGFSNGRHHGMLFTLVESDGRYYYAYLPSAIIDGDLDFSNQFREHWDVDFRPALLEERTATGLIGNKYPIGMALTLLPAFLIGHVAALATGNSLPADGYSWPYQIACVAWIQFLCWLTVRRIDRILTERMHISPGAAVWGIMVVVLGTPYLYYNIREPFMAHAVSTFWCTELVAVAVTPSITAGAAWPRLAFSAAMAVVCRPTNLFLLPVLAFGVVRRVQADGWRTTLRALPLTAVALVPIGLQMMTWRILYGSWLTYSYSDDERFLWAHPVLLQTLFSSRAGLFFWSPLLLLAVAALLRRVRDPLIGCWLLGASMLWYANSSWHCWWFGETFGARAFLELTALFGVGFGLLFTTIRDRPRLAATVAALAIVINVMLMGLYIKKLIPHDRPLLASTSNNINTEV